MTLREEIRKLAERAAIKIAWYYTILDSKCITECESAIIAGIKLALESGLSDEMCASGLSASALCIREYYANEKYTGRVRSFSDKECGDIYRAMTAQLLKELEGKL